MSVPQVWFLTGSQDLYGQQVLDQVAGHSRELVSQLNMLGQLSIEVVWKPVLATPDAIRRNMLQANSDDDCIGIIAWMHTFSPAKMWIGGLGQLRKPLLHWHTQADESLPWSTIDMDYMNLNQAAHGDREFGFIQARLRRPRVIVAGYVTHPRVAQAIAAWQRAAVGAAALRELKVVRFGDNMRQVAVTEADKTEAEIRFGVSVNSYGVNDLVAVVDAVTDTEAAAVVAEYLDLYDVPPDLAPGGDRAASLHYGAKIELGLRHFLVDGGFGAFTTNFEDLGGLRQLPGLAVQRLMSEGYGFGGEGDWETAVLGRAIKRMVSGLPGGTSFMEDYTYHFGPGQPKSLGAHMLEVDPTIAKEKPRVEIHPLAIGNRDDPVRLVFDAAPGAGLIVGLSDLGDRFRLVASEIDVVDPDQPMPKLPVARAVWLSRPDLYTAAECWITAGAPHHPVLSTQLTGDILEDFAEIVQTELAVIDAQTTKRDFIDRLRWNAAFYRLQGGI